MVWIKICGITNLEDGLNAASLGVNALGFIFAPSPRRVGIESASKIIPYLPSNIFKVGVFVNEDQKEVERIVKNCGLNAVQFHGEESPEYCQEFSLPVIKAIRIKDLESIREIERYCEVTLLLDTYHPKQRGGTGIPFPWEIALNIRRKRNFILSGGLTPWNVREAIEKVRPFGVDVSSGVEFYLGKKDLFKMTEFVKEAKKADEKT